MVRHCVGLRREELEVLYHLWGRCQRICAARDAHIITFLYLPSMNDFDIRQKFGKGVSIASETFLTIVSIASQISCPPDWAGKTVKNDTKGTEGVQVPMTASDCLASIACTHTCNCSASSLLSEAVSGLDTGAFSLRAMYHAWSTFMYAVV